MNSHFRSPRDDTANWLEAVREVLGQALKGQGDGVTEYGMTRYYDWRERREHFELTLVFRDGRKRTQRFAYKEGDPWRDVLRELAAVAVTMYDAHVAAGYELAGGTSGSEVGHET